MKRYLQGGSTNHPDEPIINFRTSSFCQNGECVAVAIQADGPVKLRSTKDANTCTLEFSCQEWADFIEGVKHDEFD